MSEISLIWVLRLIGLTTLLGLIALPTGIHFVRLFIYRLEKRCSVRLEAASASLYLLRESFRPLLYIPTALGYLLWIASFLSVVGTTPLFVLYLFKSDYPIASAIEAAAVLAAYIIGWRLGSSLHFLQLKKLNDEALLDLYPPSYDY